MTGCSQEWSLGPGARSAHSAMERRMRTNRERRRRARALRKTRKTMTKLLKTKRKTMRRHRSWRRRGSRAARAGEKIARRSSDLTVHYHWPHPVRNRTQNGPQTLENGLERQMQSGPTQGGPSSPERKHGQQAGNSWFELGHLGSLPSRVVHSQQPKQTLEAFD